MIDFQKAKGLGMGCWQLAGPSSFGGRVNGYGAISKEIALETVQTAYDSGIRFFDTADAYGHGKSERYLAEGLNENSENVLICSKIGGRENESGEAFQDFSAEYTYQAVEASLERLNRDYLDILLLHNPPDDTDWSGFDKSALDDLKKQGKIRAYGVSCRSVYGAQSVVEAGFGDFVELIFNPLDRRAEDLVFPIAEEKGIQIIARVPLASGFLTDKILKADPQFDLDDIRSTFPEDMTEWMLESARKLNFLSGNGGGLASSSLRFSLFHPAVFAVIPGMRNPDQVRRNVAVREMGPLDEAQIEQIKEAVPVVFHKWLPK